ncbi:MAG: alpha-ribazole phosphatase [Steroidobacteraceae bacterium]|jgi:alpha-ribazole phosphatase
MDVYLIRHTRPDIADGVCYGRLDLALPAGFEAEARALQSRLPPPGRVFSSESQRCRRLAEYLAAAAGSPVTLDDRLRELDFGRWEGQHWSDIPRAQTDAWTNDMWNLAAPDGESYSALHSRVADAWESLLVASEDTVAVVGHVGPLRALITIALELPAEAFLRINLDYGGITKLSDATGGWRLDFANR